MIVGTAVCPGAPFLVDGTADAIAVQLSVVVDACRIALSRLPEADWLLLLTTGSARTTHDGPDRPAWRELGPGTVISTAPLRRSDDPDTRALTLPVGVGAGPEVLTSTSLLPTSTSLLPTSASLLPTSASVMPTSSVATLSVGTMVGAALLAHPSPSTIAPGDAPGQRRPPTTAFEITGDPAAVAGMLADRVDGAERVAILVIADGSACHGDDAPGRRDDRSATFDAALTEALAAGDPVALRTAAADRALNRAVLASTDPLTVLALLTAQRPPTAAELLYSGAPMGVGYFVASWLWGAG